MQTPRSRKHVVIFERAPTRETSSEAWLTWGLFAASALLVLVSAALV